MRNDDTTDDETVIIRPRNKSAASNKLCSHPQSQPIVNDPFAAILMDSSGDQHETRILRSAQSVTAQQTQKAIASGMNPITGLLLIISGPGTGAFRPLFYGNNSIGRSSHERVPLDFGDDAISNMEQAYIRYDPEDRQFLFIPNLTKSNIVAVNGDKPTAPVSLRAGDIIKMGQTCLRFVPVCGADFDWGDIDAK